MIIQEPWKIPSEEEKTQQQAKPDNMPNVKNPFRNPQENEDYRCDYRIMVPYMEIPGYKLPLYPGIEEKKAIRKSMNAGGLGAFLAIVVSQLSCTLLLYFFLGIAYSITGNNQSAIYDYFCNSSISIAINGICFFFVNLAIALIGCKYIDFQSKTLFRKTNFTGVTVLIYAMIGIFLQCSAGLLYEGFTQLFDGVSETGTIDDLSYFSSGKAVICTVLYTCILAPIGEELLFRGFLMKAFSRVSLRFGAIVTAALFALGHGNVAQFILAFILGIFLAKIDQRHNSIIPSIVVHVTVNSFSMIWEMAMYLLPGTASDIVSTFIGMCYYLIAIVGLVMWIITERKRPLSYNTQAQSIRGRVMWTSGWLLAALAVGIALMIGNEVLA